MCRNRSRQNTRRWNGELSVAVARPALAQSERLRASGRRLSRNDVRIIVDDAAPADGQRSINFVAIDFDWNRLAGKVNGVSRILVQRIIALMALPACSASGRAFKKETRDVSHFLRRGSCVFTFTRQFMRPRSRRRSCRHDVASGFATTPAPCCKSSWMCNAAMTFSVPRFILPSAPAPSLLPQ